MARLVALLRGINLGSRNRVAMADLRALLEELGYEDVRTLLQSGNAVFTSSDRPAAAAKRIETAVARDLGVNADVLVRTRAELAKVVAHNPLAEHVTDGKRSFVLFLSAKPSAKLLRELDAAAYEPERLAAHGRELYVWLPAGLHKAKLSHAVLEKRLGVVATARNWNTVEKLLALAGEG